MILVLAVLAILAALHWWSGRRHPLRRALGRSRDLERLDAAFTSLDRELAERRAWEFCQASSTVFRSSLRFQLTGSRLELATAAGTLALTVYTEEVARRVLALTSPPSLTDLRWVADLGWVVELATEHGPMHCLGWQLAYR